MHSIVEVSRKTKLSARTLRVWEEEGLLQSARDAGGMRCFAVDVFCRVEKIRAMKDLGLSLKEIKMLLDGEVGDGILLAKRQEVEAQALKIARTQRKLEQLETLLKVEKNKLPIDLTVPSQVIAERCLQSLLKSSSRGDVHCDYLLAEFEGMQADEIISWFVTLRKIKECADREGVPTRFVRGYASSSLSLFLAGLTQCDPCGEGLVPSSPLVQDLHFDVPYSHTEHFFEALAEVNRECDEFNCVAFRLPVLDIMSEFAKSSSCDPYDSPTHELLLESLRAEGCRFIFGLDESGKSLLNRTYPELSEELRSVDATNCDLRRFNPTCREDVLRFMALRRQVTWKLFHQYCDGRPHERPNCRLASFLPPENRGYVFFREEMLAAVQRATGWSWGRVATFRRNMRDECLSQEEIDEFIGVTDERSFCYFNEWDALYFHKAHLVGWWQLIAATLKCRMHDAKLWERTLRAWEDKNDLAWNDFGVIWRDAKLLTPC